MAFIKLTREILWHGEFKKEDWYVDANAIYAFGRNPKTNKTTVRYSDEGEGVFETPEQILLMIESAKRGGAE